MSAPPFWTKWLRDMRLSMWVKQAGKCHYCERAMQPPPIGKAARRNRKHNNLRCTLEHLRPLSRGGLMYDVFNLVLACQRCNTAKGDLTEEEFRAFLVEHGRFPKKRDRFAAARKRYGGRLHPDRQDNTENKPNPT